jgi:hypothetical protein
MRHHRYDRAVEIVIPLIFAFLWGMLAMFYRML